ncbi:MAG: hypothetical protein ACXWKC_13615 [Xanthobacteraceae bacterium]
MRKFGIVCLAVVTTVLISGSIIAAGHKDAHVTTVSIDPTAITRAAGDLPIVQVNEPF